MGLINWAIQKLYAKGFTPLSTPDLVRSGVVEKCGFQPRAENTQVSCELHKLEGGGHLQTIV
jgi:seryl-tRNA synthetase